MRSLDVRLIQGAVRIWLRYWKMLLFATVVVVVTAVASSGIYTVPTNQTGALFFLGKLVRDDVPPGIHFRLPSPLQRVHLANTSEVRRMTLTIEDQNAVAMVTADENIIELEVALQYKISDFSKYLTGCEDWEQVMRLLVTAKVSQLVAEIGVDEILTTGKSAIQVKLRTLAQQALDSYGSGLTLLSTTIVFVRPPFEPAASFRAVADAKSEKAKKVSVAEAKRSNRLSMARGEAAKIRGQAKSKAQERVKRAQGESKRYLAIYDEYRQAKKVTKADLYYKSMERVLQRSRLLLFSPDQHQAIDLTLFSGQPPQRSKMENRR